MRLKVLIGAALTAALGVVMLPGSALSNVNVHEHADAIVEFDSRAGTIAPTRAQRARVRQLKASATWSQFGTPATLTRRGRFLARGIRAHTATDAARWYLNRHRALFGLRSVQGLAFDSTTRLTGSNGYVVNFRQVFGGLTAQEGGLVSVAVTGTARRGWKVGFVSSSLTRDRALAGTIRLSAAQALVRAAGSVGVRMGVANILKRRMVAGWTHYTVGGLGDTQRVRRIAFPTVRHGVLPAYETIVLKGHDAFAYKSIVDARNGALLARSNLVHNLNGGGVKLMAAESYSFSGTLGPEEGACAMNGPFSIGSGNRALDGFANAHNPVNDVVLELWKDGALVPGTHADTFLTPERFRYEPAGGVPAGDYFMRVCDFDSTANNNGWLEPRTYEGTLIGDASAPPPAFLARWKVFPANPPLHTLGGYPWNHPDTDTRETWCWVMAPGCDRVMGSLPLGSRGPWDHDHKTNTATLTTRGNNARAATSWTDPFFPSAPQYSPVSAGRDYSFAWTNAWNNEQCEPTPDAPGATWDDSAAAVNLFVAHNRMHDWAYGLGFNERNWNAQDYNFGLTERRQENDPIIGNVQAGATSVPPQRDNANMITLPDGQSSVTNMYFWQPLAGVFYAPCVDGDYDMGVIGHEYGHMIENRMLGKGNVRSGHHAGAMGESSGDQFGMEYLVSNGFVPTSDENGHASGTYDTGNKLRAIRNYGMNFPTFGGVPEPSKQLNVNALNFSDMGYDVTGPTFTSSQQVHANGEIWSKANFVLRQLLVDKYNRQFPYDDEELQYSCANGETPVHRCPGNRRWIQLYFDAMLIAPFNATMLQSRDALLAADMIRFGGANQSELWLGYARQGYGAGATTTNGPVATPPGSPVPCNPCGTLAETDTDPTPSFESPLHSNATVTFQATDLDGNPINARFYVGHYEARVSPVADTNGATTGSSNLDNVAPFAPGTYELLAHAPGYGHVRFRERFRSGETETVRVEFPRNWASASAGATITGDGADLGSLIDDTENTNWNAPGTLTGGNLSVDGKQATIDFAGTDDKTIRYVQVSAQLRSGNSRFAALRQFELWACNADEGGNCSTAAGFTKRYTSPADAFPGNPPRPVAPHLILRKFDVPDFEATHIMFVVKTSQCTGGPDFQGEQDADPTATTECDVNVPAGHARSVVRTAELQVFDRKADID